MDMKSATGETQMPVDGGEASWPCPDDTGCRAGSVGSPAGAGARAGAQAVPAHAADFDDAASAEANEAAACEPVPASLTAEEAIARLKGADSGIRPNLLQPGYRAVKRAFDLVASGVAIAVLLVPSLALCAAICIKSPGASPLYSQVRVGRLKADGTYRLFRMWKFRSMVPHADEMLPGLQGENEASGPLFKIRDDPRVIGALGRFIRKHSIDELPQLINVFLGQMSLIGPRPGLPTEVAQYDEHAKQRLCVKPGCGGAWQVGNRSDSTFNEMVAFDLAYANNCSVAYDLKLVFATIRAMITGGGAY